MENNVLSGDRVRLRVFRVFRVLNIRAAHPGPRPLAVGLRGASQFAPAYGISELVHRYSLTIQNNVMFFLLHRP